MIISAFLGTAGLSDIGYRFYTTAEAPVAARVTAGIVDAGDGWYSADATIPSTGSSVRWDSTGTVNAKAREYLDSLNDPFTKVVPNGYAAGTAGKKLGGLPDAVAGSAGGVFIAGSNANTNVNITGNRTGDLIGNVTGTVHDVTNAYTPEEIAAATRDVSNASPAVGSLGADVKTGASSGDPWGIIVPGAYAAGTAGKILGDNLDAKVSTRLATSGYTVPPTPAVIGVACRDTNNATPAAGSVGDKINSAASSGDPWGTALPGAYSAGTAGKIIGDRLDVLVSSRLATTGYTNPPTPTVIAESCRDVNNLTPAANSLGAAVNNAAAAGDPWVANIGTYTTPGTAGKLMNDQLDAKVSTRMPASSYVAPPTPSAIGIACRDTDNTSPASGSVGDKINNAASAGDPWGTVLPSATYPPGTAGDIIGQNIDAKISVMLPSASYVVPPSTSLISEAVRDVDNTAPAANSLGAAINSGSQDPLAKLVPGSYLSGTAGKIIGDNLDAKVSTRSTYNGADTSGVTTLLGRIGSVLNITLGKVDVNDKTGFSLTPDYDKAKTAAQPGDAMTISPGEKQSIAATIWDTLTSALSSAGSIGKLIVDYLNASVGSRLATASYVAPDNVSITAIKAKTDTIPPSPASVSDIPTSAQNAAATRDVSNATPVPGSLGADVKTGAQVGDPWSLNLPGSYPSGTAGNILGVRLDANISSRLPTSNILLNGGQVTVGTNNDKTGYSLAAGDAVNIADEVLKRDWQLVNGEAAYSVLNALRFLRDPWEVKPDGTLIVYQEDGASIAWTRSVRADENALPITGVQ